MTLDNGYRPVVMDVIGDPGTSKARSPWRIGARTSNLRIASIFLGMSVADLDCVRDARNLSSVDVQADHASRRGAPVARASS